MRIGVIGCGHMGALHARKLGLMGVLAAVADTSQPAAEALALETGAMPFTDYRGMLGTLDAVVIATPTSSHAKIALQALDAGCHVLVEKPIAHDIAAAGVMVAAAKDANRMLLCGHVERFNPAFRRFRRNARNPMSIYAERGSVLNGRAPEGGIVSDLMIHDIDLVITLWGCPSWVGSTTDGHITRAMLGYPGKRATITAHYGKRVRAWTAVNSRGVEVCDFTRVGSVDPLTEQLRFFVESIKTGLIVQDYSAKAALEIAHEVQQVTA